MVKIIKFLLLLVLPLPLAGQSLSIGFVPSMTDGLLAFRGQFALKNNTGIFVDYVRTPDYEKRDVLPRAARFGLLALQAERTRKDMMRVRGLYLGLMAGAGNGFSAYASFGVVDMIRYDQYELGDNELLVRTHGEKRVGAFGFGVVKHFEHEFISAGVRTHPQSVVLGFGFRLLPFYLKF